MRKEFALFAAIAAVFAFMTFGAQAMPAVPLAGVAKASGHVVQVSGGCGPFPAPRTARSLPPRPLSRRQRDATLARSVRAEFFCGRRQPTAH